METIYKCSLRSVHGQLIAVGYGTVPYAFDPNPNAWIQVSIYRIPSGYCFCLSHGTEPKEEAAAIAALGNTVPGASFEKFAVRFIGKELPLAELKQIVEETIVQMREVDMHWWEDAT